MKAVILSIIMQSSLTLKHRYELFASMYQILQSRGRIVAFSEWKVRHFEVFYFRITVAGNESRLEIARFPREEETQKNFSFLLEPDMYKPDAK